MDLVSVRMLPGYLVHALCRYETKPCAHAHDEHAMPQKLFFSCPDLRSGPPWNAFCETACCSHHTSLAPSYKTQDTVLNKSFFFTHFSLISCERFSGPIYPNKASSQSRVNAPLHRQINYQRHQSHNAVRRLAQRQLGHARLLLLHASPSSLLVRHRLLQGRGCSAAAAYPQPGRSVDADGRRRGSGEELQV